MIASTLKTHFSSALIPAVIALCSMFAGCGSLYRYEMAPRGEPVKSNVVSCSSPFVLAKGCESNDLATQAIDLHGLIFNLSGTEDGTTILVKIDKIGGGTSVFTNLIFDAVRTILAGEGLAIEKATAIQDRYWEGADVFVGYFITANGDAFSVIQKYASAVDEPDAG